MPLTTPNESAEYRAARDTLLGQEIALRRQMEAVAVARRALPPGGVVPEDYAFDALDDAGTTARLRLSELFGDGQSVLFYQMMFPRYSTDTRAAAAQGATAKLPLKEQPCPSCTALVDQLNAAAEHFAAGGGRFYIVAKTAIANLAALAQDRGWRHLRLLSAAGTTFKRDYLSEVDGEQLPMLSAFRRDPDGTVRHFWSSEMTHAETDPGEHARAQGTVEPLWNMFDLMPKGRPDFDEQLQYDCCAEAGASAARES